MRKFLMIAAAACTSFGFATAARAATLQVGPNQQYTTPCVAIAAAQPQDVVEVAPGTYTDSCEINVAGLTVKGVGGMPKIDLSGTDHPADYKGIYVVNADDVRLENLELTGANISDANGANGAGLRVVGSGLVVHGCFIHDNQDGILGTPASTSATITVEYSELAHNGIGNGCNVGGCTHNVYLNHFAKALFQFNWSHDIGTDGHLLKSRAAQTFVLYNRLTGEDGSESYDIDLPNGGLAVVVGNVVQKGPNAHNSVLLNYGEEGASNADNRLFVVNNTFVNDLGKGTFINVAGGTLSAAHNNLIVGMGAPLSTGTLSADNLVGIDPMFVNAAGYDYHLKSGSPAIDKGVDPGAADQLSLTPVDEYVHPRGGSARKSDGKLDVGAFEYGSDPTVGVDGGAPGADAGAASGDAGSGRSADAGGGAGGDSGAGAGAGPGADAGTPANGAAPAPGSDGGCSMTATQGAGSMVGVFTLFLAAVAAARRRRAPGA